MTNHHRLILGTVFFAMILALLVAVRGLSSPDAQAALRYQSTCALIEPNSADGYVSNPSQDVYQVVGAVRFTFPAGYSMSRPDIVIQANSSIPPGQTARVVRARLMFQPRPGETCLFDVKNAIRKL